MTLGNQQNPSLNLACYLVVKQQLLLETKIQMEGQEKEYVDDDMFSKTNNNFSGMAAHTLEYGALLRIFFTCIGFMICLVLLTNLGFIVSSCAAISIS